MKNLNDYIGKLVSMRDDIVYVVTSARSVKKMNTNYDPNTYMLGDFNSEYVFVNELALTEFSDYMYDRLNVDKFVEFSKINFILMDQDKLSKLIDSKTKFALLKRQYERLKHRIDLDIVDFIKDEDNLKFG